MSSIAQSGSVLSASLLEQVFSDAKAIARARSLETFHLGNRRYLGGKSKLLDFIEATTLSVLGRNPTSVFDAFSGTGVVASHFAELGSAVVGNDLLLHNSVAFEAFLSSEEIDLEGLAEKLLHLASLSGSENYFSEHFGGTFFSEENAQRIGAIREEIDVIADRGRERAALLTSLFYGADRVANTVGHYDAFRRGAGDSRPLTLKFPLLRPWTVQHEWHQEDAVELAPKVKTEVAYLDPPYNSRQYSDAYHLLENLVRWEKPEVFGVARKMDRTNLKSDFCGRSAPKAFDDLIQGLNADLILVSYNNNQTSMDARSNAAISDEQLVSSLEKRGRVSVRETSFNFFSAGKTRPREHSERIFICEVKPR